MGRCPGTRHAPTLSLYDPWRAGATEARGARAESGQGGTTTLSTKEVGVAAEVGDMSAASTTLPWEERSGMAGLGKDGDPLPQVSAKLHQIKKVYM